MLELCCSTGAYKITYTVILHRQNFVIDACVASPSEFSLFFLLLSIISPRSQQSGHKPVYSPDDTAVIGCKPIPANMEVFNSYVNGALQRALGERLARWGTEYIDPENMKEPTDKQGRSLGVRVYEAYSCQFGFIRNSSTDIPRVGLTVDLRAKIVRTMVSIIQLR